MKIEGVSTKQTNLFGQAKKVVYSSETSQGIYGQKRLSVSKASKSKEEPVRQYVENKLAKNHRMQKGIASKETKRGQEATNFAVVSESQLERM